MKNYILSCALACVLFTPAFAHAAVIINEIAWMGTNVSATDEWMELFNSGAEEVSLAGWKVIAEDGAPLITLSGTIAADGYYLLERTDDGSVPDIPADKIYTGDLSNSGETLKLVDAGGAMVDTVAGGTNWGTVGGNNTTKDTPQRQPDLTAQADATWLTGIPTPKAVNTTIASTPPSGGEVAGTTTAATAPARKRVITGGYKQVVFAYAGEDVAGVAGAAVQFEGYAVTDKNIPLSTAMYQWSFGDGGHARRKDPTHVYEEPGTYVVTLRVFGKHQTWQDRITATILPARVIITDAQAGGQGYIEVQNDGDTDLDLSGWKLRVRHARKTLRGKTFTIPEGTLIPPRASVRFPSRVTSLLFADEDTIVLQFPSGETITELEKGAPDTATDSDGAAPPHAP